ncbi:hypothetical protein D1013_13250 [Euzebyella marina]|uniref:Uncharacterized protein n=1 Tax=Euzebyella marina TaxID=1761453 RepID=A0A3G2L7L9_9FLAO|nr:hypothetical protein [Euzebyella marina]AYN68274.1 hypothetical protein D1013_13250 [Euzebyella marina]
MRLSVLFFAIVYCLGLQLGGSCTLDFNKSADSGLNDSNKYFKSVKYLTDAIEVHEFSEASSVPSLTPNNFLPHHASSVFSNEAWYQSKSNFYQRLSKSLVLAFGKKDIAFPFHFYW